MKLTLSKKSRKITRVLNTSTRRSAVYDMQVLQYFYHKLNV